MGLIEQLPCYIASERIDALEQSSVITSINGECSLPVAKTTSAQLRKALRFATESQKKLNETSLAERIAVARLVLNAYGKYRAQVIWGLAKFRGMVAKDSHWMCELLEPWSRQIETLIEAATGQAASFTREVKHGGIHFGNLSFQSRGPAALFCASTMDGPPAVDVICHAILSGTHLILRPSWRDTVTHYVLETLFEHGLTQHAQLVRWPSSEEECKMLDRQLLQYVAQGAVFGSDETYETLLRETAPNNMLDLVRRFAKYGTGLPLVIVTKEADIPQAARDIVEGSRRANGRFCLSHGPVLVEQECAESLKECVITEAKTLTEGDLLQLETDKGHWAPADMQNLKEALPRFGGRVAYGSFKENTMDVIVLEDVPKASACLHDEFPGTIVGLVPFVNVDEAIQVAQKSLQANSRDAWLALNIFSDEKTYAQICSQVDAYHYQHGRVTPEPKFVLPHQGSYFLLDLMRRQVKEH